MNTNEDSTPVSSLPITKKNFQAAQKFLDLFDYRLTTIQVRQDRQGATSPGEYLWTGEEGSSVCAFEGALYDHPDLVRDITLHQNQGMSLWYMVNEGDGEIYPPNKTPRSQKNVTHLTACFVDTDLGDIKKLEKFCTKNDVPYNLRVETSPGKYHVYFLIEKTEATEDNVLKWEAIQRRLMALDPKYDRSLADTSQLLRVPFFYHNKKAPFLIKVFQDKDAPKYTLDELYELTEAHKYMRLNGQGERFEYPTGEISSGGRHYSLVAYLRHLSAKAPDLSKDDLENAGLGFARKHFEEPKEFMPGGPRYRELVHNVESVVRYAEEEKRQEAVARLDELTEKTQARKDAFYIPPEFFFECPNKMIGEMVKHISSTALYPCTPYDFAAVVAMVGTLKSHLFISSEDHPPVNYFLCFGPSGIGKNHSQRVVAKAMSALGEGQLVATSIKTEKGLYRGLSENSSRYFVMMDEVEGLLSLLTGDGRQVETYTRSLKDALLRLYTHHDRVFQSAMTGNERERPYQIPNPHLNFIGYGTPTALTHGFSVKSIGEGLLPRFVVLSAPNVRVRNEGSAPAAKLEAGHLEYLRDVVMKGKGLREKDYIELEDLQAELSELQESVKTPGRPPKQVKDRMEEILGRVAELKNGGRVIGKAEVVPFTSKAKNLYDRFHRKMDAKYNADPDSPLSPLYTRVAEKAGRLATVIAEEKITSDTLEWCLEFCEKQLESEMDACGSDGSNLGMNYEEKQYRRFLDLVGKHSKGSGFAKRRDVSRSMRIGLTLFDKLVMLGLERDEISRETVKSKGRKVEAFSLTGL